MQLPGGDAEKQKNVHDETIFRICASGTVRNSMETELELQVGGQ